MLNASTTSTTKEQLEQLCNRTIDNSQDFTDSVYISIEQRDKVLEYHRKLQDQLAELIKIISNTYEVRLLRIRSFLIDFYLETDRRSSDRYSIGSKICSRISSPSKNFRLEKC